MKKVIAGVIAPVASGSAVVDAYLRDIDHPFKAEMEAVRRSFRAELVPIRHTTAMVRASDVRRPADPA